MSGHAIKLHQRALGVAPKALDAVDMNTASGEFVVAVVDPQMLVKAYIYQTVVAAPEVGASDADNVRFNP